MEEKRAADTADASAPASKLSDLRPTSDVDTFLARHCPMKESELVAFLTDREQSPGLLKRCRRWLVRGRGKSGRLALSVFTAEHGRDSGVDMFESHYHAILWIYLFSKFDIDKASVGTFRAAFKQTMNSILWLMERNDLVYGERMSIAYVQECKKLAGPNPVTASGAQSGGTYFEIDIQGGRKNENQDLASLLQMITIYAINEPLR